MVRNFGPLKMWLFMCEQILGIWSVALDSDASILTESILNVDVPISEPYVQITLSLARQTLRLTALFTVIVM
jgi:hypothetical protein